MPALNDDESPNVRPTGESRARRRAWMPGKIALFSLIPLLILGGATELLFRARFRSSNLLDNLHGSGGELGTRTNGAGYFWLASARRQYVGPRHQTRTSEAIQGSSDLIRIAVIGGSSAAGYPHEARLAFPNILRIMLESLYPQADFQVLNLAYFAQTYDFGGKAAREVFPLRPHFLLIYSGHNEHYPYNIAQLIARRERSNWRRSLDALAEDLATHSRAFGWVLDQRRQPGYVMPSGFEAAHYLDEMVDNYAAISDEIATAAGAAGTRVLHGTLVRNLADFPPEPYETTRDATFPPLDPADFVALDSPQQVDPRHLYRLGRWHQLHGEETLARERYVQASDRVTRLSRVHSKIQAWIERAHEIHDNVVVVDTEGFVQTSARSPSLGDNEILDWVHPRPSTNYLIALAYLAVMRPALDSELGMTTRDVPALAEIEPLLASDVETSKANGLVEAGFVNLQVGRPDVAFALLLGGLEKGPSEAFEIKGAFALALLNVRINDLPVAQSIVDVVKDSAARELVDRGFFDFRNLEGADTLRAMLE